jgi:hypothetical protein
MLSDRNKNITEEKIEDQAPRLHRDLSVVEVLKSYIEPMIQFGFQAEIDSE